MKLDGHGRSETYSLGGYGYLAILILLGGVLGLVVGSVFGTHPVAVTVAKYVAPACAIVGLVAGAIYGFFFNISNHCRGGRIVCGVIGSVGAAAAGMMAVALAVAALGALGGFGLGWLVGSLLTSSKRGWAPWIGTGIGAIFQAFWMDYALAVKHGALGCVVGAIAGPTFLLMCLALGYLFIEKPGNA